MTVALIKTIYDIDHSSHSSYKAIIVWCPGCERTTENYGPVGGAHMLPITGDSGKRPTWVWNHDLQKVTLEPSIMIRTGDYICHSFLRDGVWEFLSDSTHKYAGQKVPMVELPPWLD